MKFTRTTAELREALSGARSAGRSIGLVPTMGALHAGHLALIEAARSECDAVALSAFVNPMQFGAGEDLATYPRDPERDRELAARAGADLIHAPGLEEVYPEGFATRVEVEGLTEVLCGRPGSRGAGHFHGVTTVVCKLLNAAQPDRAYFGRKDAQQLAVIRRMVADLEMPVEIRAVDTVREPDGLAMSSRNAYLGPEERRRAGAIPQALRAASAEADAGGDLDAALARAGEELRKAGLEPEYLEARDPDTLEELSELNGGPTLVAVAAQVGRARLIDNILIEPSSREEAGTR